jgi:hypothetical protein
VRLPLTLPLFRSQENWAAHTTFSCMRVRFAGDNSERRLGRRKFPWGEVSEGAPEGEARPIRWAPSD